MCDESENDEPHVGEEPPEENSFAGTVFSHLANFDWLKIPGAVRAISMLVTGSAEAGKAWIDVMKVSGEARAKRIRDLSNARSEGTKAMAAAAIKSAKGNPELVDRAVDRFIG